MEDFAILTDQPSLTEDIISHLKEYGCNMVVFDNGDLHISKEGFKDQYEDDQFLLFRAYQMTNKMMYEYEDRQLILSMSGNPPIQIVFWYRLGRGLEFLYAVIDRINDMIIAKKLNNRVIIDDGYTGIRRLFDDFLEKWKLQRGFFHKD